MTRQFNKSGRLFTLIAFPAMLLASGCAESLSRQETISPSLGNAMAANSALQTIDPWPSYVERTHVHTDGARASNAIDAYRTPPSDETSSGSAITILSPSPKTGS